MVGVSILLSWLPVLGPSIAGLVGGRKAGGVGPALLAAIVPAIVVGVLLLLLGSLAALPVIGGLVGAGVFFVLLANSLPLLVGAATGGALPE